MRALSLRTKVILGGAAAWLLAVGAAVALVLAVSHAAPSTARGFGGVPGGGFVPPTKLGGTGGGGGGDITGVTAGTGLTGGATSGNATLNVDTTTIQARVPTSCGAGTFMTAIASSGTATCTTEPGDIAGVTAGTSLTGGGTSGTVTLNVALPGASCSAGNAVTAISAGGTGTCSGSQFFNTAGTGLSSSGSTVSANLAGGTCTVGKVVTAVSAAGAATCTSPTVNNYADTHLEWVDEWMLGACATSAQCGSIYGLFVSGAGAAYAGAAGTSRPGIGTIATGTTTTGRSALLSMGTSVDFGSGNWTFEATGGVPVLSTVTDEYSLLMGFGDVNSSSNQTDGCYFLYDRGNVSTSGPNAGNADKLSCWCSNNLTRTTYLMNGVAVSDNSFTTVDAPVAALTLPSTNILGLKIAMTGSTKAEFYVNGTKSCEIATNIPTGSARVTGAIVSIIKSAGTTSTLYDVDRTRVAVDLTSARSP